MMDVHCRGSREDADSVDEKRHTKDNETFNSIRNNAMEMRLGQCIKSHLQRQINVPLGDIGCNQVGFVSFLTSAYDMTCAISHACFWGHAECVRALLGTNLFGMSNIHGNIVVSTFEALVTDHVEPYRVPEISMKLWTCYDNPKDAMCALLSATNLPHMQLKPLMVCAQGGEVDCLRVLMEYGCDISRSDVNGTSPLVLALRQGNTSIVRLLLDNGVNVNPTHVNLRNYPSFGHRHIVPQDRALYCAAAGSTAEHVSELIALGSDVRGRSDVGESALHAVGYWEASEKKKKVWYLLSAGVPIRVVRGTYSPAQDRGEHRFRDLAYPQTTAVDDMVDTWVWKNNFLPLSVDDKEEEAAYRVDCQDAEGAACLLFAAGDALTDKRLTNVLPSQMKSIVIEDVETLRGLCRVAIRVALLKNFPGVSIFAHIGQLPLPCVLKNFLVHDFSWDNGYK